jgi:hypothetical protein
MIQGRSMSVVADVAIVRIIADSVFMLNLVLFIAAAQQLPTSINHNGHVSNMTPSERSYYNWQYQQQHAYQSSRRAKASLPLSPDKDDTGELGFFSRGAMNATNSVELLWSSMADDRELRERLSVFPKLSVIGHARPQ